MGKRLSVISLCALFAAGLFAWFMNIQPARAHCDTLDGPVVKTARLALTKGNVTPVLKWVKPHHEAEVRAAFKRTLDVRRLSPASKELADRYFFETLVRVHRAGEGAPYTGLKPAGQEVSPAILASDRALETGNADALARRVADSVSKGIRTRFARVMETKKHADSTVGAGREYVEAYVEFIHYVERLDEAASSSAHGHYPVAEGGEHSER